MAIDEIVMVRVIVYNANWRKLVAPSQSLGIVFDHSGLKFA